MNNKFAIFCGAVLVIASASAIAMDDMKMDMKAEMKMMDANGDAMISKEEFTKHHEMMYDKMKKNKSGMVDMKDMMAMHKDMNMKHKGGSHDAMMKDKAK